MGNDGIPLHKSTYPWTSRLETVLSKTFLRTADAYTIGARVRLPSITSLKYIKIYIYRLFTL